ncbi:MAG TPA: hypothetical protein VGG39_33770 [Polyangiaceae bacterium]|jgi:hypothetical protein
MKSLSALAVMVAAGVIACGSSSSGPGGGGGSPDASALDGGTADGNPFDAVDGATSADTGPGSDSATDACPTDAEAACGCKDTAPFAPADPSACDACLTSSCATQLAAYESSCWIVQDCTCSCSGFDDTCTNNAQPFYTCGHTTCAAQCAGADGSGIAIGDAAAD